MPELKPIESHGWWLGVGGVLRSLLPVCSLSSRAILLVESLSGLLRLLVGACICGFAIASASLIPMLETLASSCARWLSSLASVSFVGLDNAAAIGEGGEGAGS